MRPNLSPSSTSRYSFGIKRRRGRQTTMRGLCGLRLLRLIAGFLLRHGLRLDHCGFGGERLNFRLTISRLSARLALQGKALIVDQPLLGHAIDVGDVGNCGVEVEAI